MNTAKIIAFIENPPGNSAAGKPPDSVPIEKPAPAANEEPATTNKQRPENTCSTENPQGVPTEKTPASQPKSTTGDSSEDHANPVDLDPFPLDALGPVLRQIAEEVARCHQVPVEMVVLGLLGVLSAAVPRNFILIGAVNGKDSHANLYFLIFAPKSAGKSSLMAPLIRQFQEWAKKLVQAYREKTVPLAKTDLEILQSRKKQLLRSLEKTSEKSGAVERRETEEELQKVNQQIDMLERQLKSEPTLWVGDHTSEKLSSILASNHEQCLIYSPEAGEVLRVMAGRYSPDGKASYGIYLSGWSVEDHNVARVGRGSITITPCLSMLLFGQPCILEEILEDREADERGLLARTIMAKFEWEPQPDDGVIRTIDPNAQRNWDRLIDRLLDERFKPDNTGRTLHCTPEARTVFRIYHNEVIELRRGKFCDDEANLGRAREIAIRIALNLALADNPDATEVTEELAKRAVSIGRWCLLKGLELTAHKRTRSRDEALDKLVTLLRSKGGSVTVRDLKKSHGYNDPTIDLLVKHSRGALVKDTLETGGRPSQVIRVVNPPKAPGL